MLRRLRGAVQPRFSTIARVSPVRRVLRTARSQPTLAVSHALRLASVLARRLMAEHGVAEQRGDRRLAVRGAVIGRVVALRRQALALPRDAAQGVGEGCFDVVLVQRRHGQEGQAGRRLHPRAVGCQDVPVDVQANRDGPKRLVNPSVSTTSSHELDAPFDRVERRSFRKIERVLRTAQQLVIADDGPNPHVSPATASGASRMPWRRPDARLVAIAGPVLTA